MPDVEREPKYLNPESFGHFNIGNEGLTQK